MSRKKVDILLENMIIEACAAEGKALTHWDGAVVFVPFAVPGDLVDIRITRKYHNYYEGFISRIVKPSKDRIEPSANISAPAAAANGSLFLTRCSSRLRDSR